MKGMGTDHVSMRGQSGPLRGLKKLHPMAQTDRQKDCIDFFYIKV